MQLSDIIIQRIQEEGPISFHDFMEMALYLPGKGYYANGTNRIGKTGDFYTSPELTPAFGAMIARQLEEMWVLLGRKDFTIVEYGAGTGKLCHDILAYLQNNSTFYERINYCIIERSPSMRAFQQTFLDEKVNWYNSISEMPPISGCILSNELLDNFPVHGVVMEEELMEVFVDYNEGFTESFKPANQALTDYLKELQVALPKGYRTEINLEATKWIKEIATALKEGFVLTIDYGYPSSQLYSERRKTGTILCYHQHTINDYAYAAIGEQDITAHVNFSALCHWGFKYGLQCCGCTNQANFLLALGFPAYLRFLLSLETGKDLFSIVK
jgi:SAM-dependent MidA family methyltransferase